MDTEVEAKMRGAAGVEPAFSFRELNPTCGRVPPAASSHRAD